MNSSLLARLPTDPSNQAGKGAITFPQEDKSRQDRRHVDPRPETEPDPSDEQLMDRMARKEGAALSLLYDRYGRLVFSLAASILHDRSAAEEIVQEVFTTVWRMASEFRPERGKVSSWLMTICHHRSIDELRRRRSRPAFELTERLFEHELTDGGDPAESALFVFERAHLKEALARIPDEQRAVIQLAYFEGCTQREIADRGKIPLSTVKTRMRLGLQKLRESLARQGHG